MSVLRTGVHGVDCHGVIPVTYMGTGALGLPPLDFDEALCTFTAGMAKRDTSGNVFAASPIVQGDWDGTGTPDILTAPRGALISGAFYANLDFYQYSVVFWVTPEWSGNDNLEHRLFQSGNFVIYKTTGNNLVFFHAANMVVVDISAWIAGTTYCIVARIDGKNTLDGTNYACLSINGVHTFGRTTLPTGNSAPTMYIGSSLASVSSADAIIEGLTVYRRPLWDGAYGVDVGNGDEVALISAGVDPCTVTGSWGIPFCLPTNAAVGALVTGTGEAWSHPHAAAETNLTDAFCQTAYATPCAWTDAGTPITPSAYLFDGAATLINCGSNAVLDNLPSQPAGKGTFTAEAWIRADGWGEGNLGIVCDKSTGGVGWTFYINNTLGLYAHVYCATTDARAQSGLDDFTPDGRWHHVAMTWNDLTYNYPRLWIDGIEVSYDSTTNRVGAVVLDAAVSLYIGNYSTGAYTFDGKIAWSRLSDNIRYASPFVPPPLTNPPAVDGNTIEQWNFQDCAGVTAVAQVNPGAPPGGCDGQITAGAGGWNCTKDMDDFAVGDRIAEWGYIFGSDAVDEGITQTAPGAPLTAGQNYVLSVPVNLGADSNGRARIRVRDLTNAANIVDFDGPLMTGLHTGANNSPTLIVAGARFPQSLIGATVYNITDVNPAGNDCAKGVVTSISGDGTTMTFAGGLIGGTDGDFDTNDEYRVVWHRTGAGVRSMPADHPWCETFCFELPTIARHGVGADCVSISVMVLNALASGTVMVHQVELQENRLDNPSLETPIPGANPWIPDGWVNVNLLAGDAARDVVNVHSGVSSWDFNNVGGRYARSSPVTVVGDFYMLGCWGREVGGNVYVTSPTNPLRRQASDTLAFTLYFSGAVWAHYMGVARATAVNPWVVLSASGASQGNLDDLYLVALDDVTLTATAANQADSAEAPGLRIDGGDTCPQPIPAGYWAATSGWMRWRWTARHDAAQLVGFDEAGNEAVLAHAWGNAANFIRVFASAANTITMEFNDGGGLHTVNWACAGQVVAATTYLMEVRYTSGDMWLTQDGVERARITTPLAFAVTPTNVWWGSRQAGDLQVDAAYAAP